MCMRSAGLDWAEAGKTAERNINNLRYVDDYHPYGRKWRRTKEPLDERKEESEKVGLKLNIQKMKIMASGAITSWQIDGETVETVADCIFLGSKITADGDCSHEIKRRLLLERKNMTNLDGILKSRDITLSTKVCLVKAWFFQWSCMDVRVGLWRKLSAKELMLSNLVLEKTLESPLDCKEIQLERSALGVLWKEWC